MSKYAKMLGLGTKKSTEFFSDLDPAGGTVHRRSPRSPEMGGSPEHGEARAWGGEGGGGRRRRCGRRWRGRAQSPEQGSLLPGTGAGEVGRGGGRR